MRRFEYKKLDQEVWIRDPELNKLGLEGWELISVQDTFKDGYTASFVYFFKREIQMSDNRPS